MTFTDAIKTCFTKYIDFTGRASRSEYWWFTLFCFILNFVVSLISHNGSVLTGLCSLILLLPSLAVTVRRFHDSDHSGWWVLLVLLPFIGWLILLYFMVIRGTQATNRFGNPSV